MESVIKYVNPLDCKINVAVIFKDVNAPITSGVSYGENAPVWMIFCLDGGVGATLALPLPHSCPK